MEISCIVCLLAHVLECACCLSCREQVVQVDEGDGDVIHVDGLRAVMRKQGSGEEDTLLPLEALAMVPLSGAWSGRAIPVNHMFQLCQPWGLA
jgi:hypothetical protein